MHIQRKEKTMNEKKAHKQAAERSKDMNRVIVVVKFPFSNSYGTMIENTYFDGGFAMQGFDLLARYRHGKEVTDGR